MIFKSKSSVAAEARQTSGVMGGVNILKTGTLKMLDFLRKPTLLYLSKALLVKPFRKPINQMHIIDIIFIYACYVCYMCYKDLGVTQE